MLTIGGKTFQSRLLLGTGKYPSFETQKEAVAVSESDILTFAVRRMNIFEASQPNFWNSLIYPNIRFCRIQRAPALLKKRFGLRVWRKRQAFVT